MADSIQALANEVARINKSSTLWAQPQVQAQTTAAAVMTQPQPQMQDYMMQQYAYANPGSMSPGHMFADPRAANYALQQQHFMNPYQARFYGGQFGDNLPGAEFHTSSRLGLYRAGYTGPQASGFAQPGFISDTLALTGFRSYAGYENPYHVKVDASRRMLERGESATNMALMAGGLATMFLPGGLPIAALAMGGELALGATAGNYFQRRKETGEVAEIMRDLVSGAAATGVFGRGVGLRTASEMVSTMRTDAANDPYHSIQDYKEVLRTGAATGLFNYEDTGGEVVDKVKATAKMLNMMMMLAEDPDIQSTIKRMADFQALGIPLHQMERMTTDIKGFAGLANASFEETMSQGAAPGAQQAQMMGGSAAMGMRVGGMAMGMANRALQSGYFNPIEAARRGGKSGISQAARTAVISHLDMITGIGAAMVMDAEGNFDVDKYPEFMNTNITDMIHKSQTAFSRMDSSLYMLKQGDAKAALQAHMPMQDIFKKLDDHKLHWMTRFGKTENDYYLYMGGESGGLALKYLYTDEGRLSELRHRQQVMLEKVAKRVGEEKVANRWYSKAGRKWSQFTNWLGDWDFLDDVADLQDRADRWDSGIGYKAVGDPLKYGFDRSSREFLRTQGKDLAAEVEGRVSGYDMIPVNEEAGSLSRILTLDPDATTNMGLKLFMRKMEFDNRYSLGGGGENYTQFRPWEAKGYRERAQRAYQDFDKRYAAYMGDTTDKEATRLRDIKLTTAEEKRVHEILYADGGQRFFAGTNDDIMLDPEAMLTLSDDDFNLVLRAFKNNQVRGKSGSIPSRVPLTNLLQSTQTAKGEYKQDTLDEYYDTRDQLQKKLGLENDDVKQIVKLRALGMSNKEIITSLQDMSKRKLPKDASAKERSKFRQQQALLNSLVTSMTPEERDNLSAEELSTITKITALQETVVNKKEQQALDASLLVAATKEEAIEMLANKKLEGKLIGNIRAGGMLADRDVQSLQAGGSGDDSKNIQDISKYTAITAKAVVDLAAKESTGIFGGDTADSGYWNQMSAQLSKVFNKSSDKTKNYVLTNR